MQSTLYSASRSRARLQVSLQPGNVAVRPALAADVRDLESIVRAAYLPYVPRIGRAPAPATADYAAAVARGVVWLASVRQGSGDETPAPAGAVGLLVLVTKPGYLLLENVAVLPSMQGFGIGTRLLAFAEAHARELGLPEIRLYTNAAMTENLAYYQRRGYVETHRAMADGFSRVYFSKML
jgi:GNAT superfamily N-acetyltransferase